jgi:hypothetical protein
MCDVRAWLVQDGVSCLYIASWNGHVEVVKYLHGCGGEALLMLTKKVRRRGAGAGVCCVGWMYVCLGRDCLCVCVCILVLVSVSNCNGGRACTKSVSR